MVFLAVLLMGLAVVTLVTALIAALSSSDAEDLNDKRRLAGNAVILAIVGVVLFAAGCQVTEWIESDTPQIEQSR